MSLIKFQFAYYCEEFCKHNIHHFVNTKFENESKVSEETWKITEMLRKNFEDWVEDTFDQRLKMEFDFEKRTILISFKGEKL